MVLEGHCCPGREIKSNPMRWAKLLRPSWPPSPLLMPNLCFLPQKPPLLRCQAAAAVALSAAMQRRCQASAAVALSAATTLPPPKCRCQAANATLLPPLRCPRRCATAKLPHTKSVFSSSKLLPQTPPFSNTIALSSLA